MYAEDGVVNDKDAYTNECKKVAYFSLWLF